MGLTAPSITATSQSANSPSPDVSSASQVQIGEQLTYTETFTVPVTGAHAPSLALTLDPNLGFVCTGSSNDCVATVDVTGTGLTTTLTNLTGTTTSSDQKLTVDLPDLAYPALSPSGSPTSCPTTQTGQPNPCTSTATAVVTFTFAVYVVGAGVGSCYRRPGDLRTQLHPSAPACRRKFRPIERHCGSTLRRRPVVVVCIGGAHAGAC